MARDAIAITALSLDGGTDEPAGTTIVVANGGNVAAGGDSRGLVLRVDNTTASEKDVTIKAGAAPAVRRGLGDLTVAIAASTVSYITLETARFAQADGSIDVDFEAAMTGTVSALRLPAGAV